jgi:thiamine-phosphate pyrophosphorylase
VTAPDGPGADPWAPHLMLVTDRQLTGGRPLVDVVQAAVAGGVDAIQVREKDLPDGTLLALTRAIRQAVGAVAGKSSSPGRAVPVIVNGRPAVATSCGAGLHLPEGMPPPAVGSWPWRGRSTHGLAGTESAVREGVDYLVAGTVFATASKPGAPLLGMAGLHRIVAVAGSIPVLAIGGIIPTRVAPVILAGACGVAVQRAILQATDPEWAARSLRRAVDLALATLRDDAAPIGDG